MPTGSWQRPSASAVLGAGQGPAAHCKHVGLLLHGYSRLFADGEIVTELTCTQVTMAKFF